MTNPDLERLLELDEEIRNLKDRIDGYRWQSNFKEHVKTLEQLLESLNAKRQQLKDKINQALEFYKKYEPSIKIFDIDTMESKLQQAEQKLQKIEIWFTSLSSLLLDPNIQLFKTQSEIDFLIGVKSKLQAILKGDSK